MAVRVKMNNKSDKTDEPKTETFKVSGEELLKKFKELLHEGNVRKITILDKNGKEIVAFPLTIGVVGAVIAPALAAVGAIAALVTECTIKVERK
ncbi:MAG TPA: DUF4342 domain-containing protein [Patescibacteria group bacterium]|nr:DUF4342 domain-containing protein [Patescibacteria group bacterium]